jgi:hypothetical protein
MSCSLERPKYMMQHCKVVVAEYCCQWLPCRCQSNTWQGSGYLAVCTCLPGQHMCHAPVPIKQVLERLERGEPLDSDSDGDSPTPTPWLPRPHGTAERLKATTIHRHLAQGNLSKAASRLDFDQIALLTPSVLQQLQDLHPAEGPPPPCQKWMQPRSRCA